MIPEKAILKVVADNAWGHNYKIKSVEAYLDVMGNLILDGEHYGVGEKAYLYKKGFYKKPPKRLLVNVKNKVERATGRIEALEKTMWQIRWKACKTSAVKKGETYRDLFGQENIAESDFRNVNHKRYADVDDCNKKYVKEVESLVYSPHEDKLLAALYKKELEENHVFQVGWYLHLTEEGRQLTRFQKLALENYVCAGGALGRTALESFNRDDLKARIFHGVIPEKLFLKLNRPPNRPGSPKAII